MKTTIKARDGEFLEFGDIIETVQGTKFEVISVIGCAKLMDKDGYIFDLEGYMSPNIWVIGRVERPQII